MNVPNWQADPAIIYHGPAMNEFHIGTRIVRAHAAHLHTKPRCTWCDLEAAIFKAVHDAAFAVAVAALRG